MIIQPGLENAMLKKALRYVPGVSAIGLLMAASLAPASGEGMWSNSNAQQPIDVGMVALLAAPQNYDGKVIRTWGFLSVGFETNTICMHEEDCEVPLLKNSFALDLTQDQEREYKSLNRTYVTVQGTVRAKAPYGPALTSGKIVRISRVQGWKPFVPYEPKTK